MEKVEAGYESREETVEHAKAEITAPLFSVSKAAAKIELKSPLSPGLSPGWAELKSIPSSPFSEENDSLTWPVITTDDQGMIADGELSDGQPSPELHGQLKAVKKAQKLKRKQQPRKYVSKHFSATANAAGPPSSLSPSKNALLFTPPRTPMHPKRHISTTIAIDELSSDSSLTSLPDDIGPDPFVDDAVFTAAEKLDEDAEVLAVKGVTRILRTPTKSPYFTRAHKRRPQFLSCLPFPPLSASLFGLMQEQLAHDPFRLLIATIFLNKTPGERAMPIFFQLIAQFPTPEALARADEADVVAIIRPLGFQNQRARKCVQLARMWEQRPPRKGVRVRKLNYPCKGDGRDVGPDEIIEDDTDPRVAWEISHLPGLGPYSHDSWRMFCRDDLRGLTKDGNGGATAVGPGLLIATEGVQQNLEGGRGFEPEWKRVIPLDKELRAYLTWMWLKEGWVWNKETGERTRASNTLMKMASGGGIVKEMPDKDHLILAVGYSPSSLDATDSHAATVVEKPAGMFMSPRP